jgi:hypothetical protein
MVNVPDAGSIDALTQYGDTIRPVMQLTSLTPTSDQKEGDFGICLIVGDNYGKLMRLAVVAGNLTWLNATPTSNLAGLISAGQLAANSVTAGIIAADAVAAACIIAGAIDGQLITGATFRTGSSNPRIIIDTANGFRSLASDGGVWFQIPIGSTSCLGNGMEPSPAWPGTMVFGQSGVSPTTIVRLTTGGSPVKAEIELNNSSAATYFRIGGSGKMHIASTGTYLYDNIDTEPGVVLKINGNQVLGARGAAIANATDATSVIARLNDLLAHFRTWGAIAT